MADGVVTTREWGPGRSGGSGILAAVSLPRPCRPSILMLWGNDGAISHEDSKRCIELTGREVLPALREMGEELGLRDPFELDTPVSLRLSPPETLTRSAK